MPQKLKYICQTCRKIFIPKDNRPSRPARFCSKKCIRTSGGPKQSNENHYEWLGEAATYSSKHQWITRVLGKPSFCLYCNKKNKPEKDGRSSIQWANVDHKYSRDVKDYIPLCRKCHIKYDKKL